MSEVKLIEDVSRDWNWMWLDKHWWQGVYIREGWYSNGRRGRLRWPGRDPSCHLCKYNTGRLANISSTIPSTSSIPNIGCFFWLNPAHKLQNTLLSTIVLIVTHLWSASLFNNRENLFTFEGYIEGDGALLWIGLSLEFVWLCDNEFSLIRKIHYNVVRHTSWKDVLYVRKFLA